MRLATNALFPWAAARSARPTCLFSKPVDNGWNGQSDLRSLGIVGGSSTLLKERRFGRTGNQSTEPFVPVPIVVCGPSGSGKSTLLKRIFSEYPDKFGFSVSHTTRNPRPGETNGKEYHFVTRETMLQEIEAGNFLESAQFSGNYYGTSYKAIDDVLKSNRNVILDIDMQGAQILQNQVAAGNSKLSRRPTFIFLAPPSVEELEKRLRGRGTETEESLRKRLDAATRELKWGMTPGSVDLVIVNDDVEKAYTELKKALVG